MSTEILVVFQSFLRSEGSQTALIICQFFVNLIRHQYCTCISMSGHTYMGRPAARLETMVLVFSSYVLVYVVNIRRWLSLYGCYFLIYVMILPCSLQKPLTRNQTLFNVWLHVRTYHSRNPTKVSYLIQ